jgi:hypothetical protein
VCSRCVVSMYLTLSYEHDAGGEGSAYKPRGVPKGAVFVGGGAFRLPGLGA